jgi:hypothetical protein
MGECGLSGLAGDDKVEVRACPMLWTNFDAVQRQRRRRVTGLERLDFQMIPSGITVPTHRSSALTANLQVRGHSLSFASLLCQPRDLETLADRGIRYSQLGSVRLKRILRKTA